MSCDFVVATGHIAMPTPAKLCFSGTTGLPTPGMAVIFLWKPYPFPRWVWESSEPGAHSVHGVHRAWPWVCLTSLPLFSL